MRPFPPPELVWAPGETRLHVYALPDLRTDAVGRVCGPRALAYEAGPPHISLSYCRAPIDSGVLQSRLRRTARPSRAPLTVTRVQATRCRPGRRRAHLHLAAGARGPLGGGYPAASL